VRIFEVHETLRVSMVVQLKDLLTQYNLLGKGITYVKDEGVNLNTTTTALTSIVSYVFLLLPQPYIINYYGHATSKCYHYATNDLKVCGNMKEGLIKEA